MVEIEGEYNLKEANVVIPGSVKRQKEVHDVLLCNQKIKRWAFENAYMLFFISIFFIISWIIEVVLKYA